MAGIDGNVTLNDLMRMTKESGAGLCQLVGRNDDANKTPLWCIVLAVDETAVDVVRVIERLEKRMESDELKAEIRKK